VTEPGGKGWYPSRNMYWPGWSVELPRVWSNTRGGCCVKWAPTSPHWGPNPSRVKSHIDTSKSHPWLERAGAKHTGAEAFQYTPSQEMTFSPLREKPGKQARCTSAPPYSVTSRPLSTESEDVWQPGLMHLGMVPCQFPPTQRRIRSPSTMM